MNNPFRSRSTVMATECLIALLALNWMAWKSGWYNAEFALVSVYICKDILLAIFNHQGESNGKDVAIPKPPSTP